MKIHDTLFGLFFLALGALVLFAVKGFPNIPGQPVGPALFPKLNRHRPLHLRRLADFERSPAAYLLGVVRMGGLGPFATTCSSPVCTPRLCGFLHCVCQRPGIFRHQFHHVGRFVQGPAGQLASNSHCGRDRNSACPFCFLQTPASPPALGCPHALGLVKSFTSLIQSVA
jgi:hypothetical protein